MISMFCLIDTLILLIWSLNWGIGKVTDKIEWQLDDQQTVEDDDDDDDIEIEFLIEKCSLESLFYIIMYCYKGLLLLFGLFLSYSTRSVKLKQINDSRFIGMSIYNIVILCLITAPISLFIRNQINSHFIFVSFTILFCCFISMALIFIPKIIAIKSHQQQNGAFSNQETLSNKQELELINNLLKENSELKLKINEKDKQIQFYQQKIDLILKQEKTKVKKNVRIQEPEEQSNQSNQSNNKPDDVIIVESDSGFVSINKPSSKELSESFL